MAPHDADRALAARADEPPAFTLVALCQASGALPLHVLALVDEGLLQPSGQGPADWRFNAAALAQTRRALRLAHDFSLDLAALALVLDLLDEIDRLRAGWRGH